jgi:hypothetical protein
MGGSYSPIDEWLSVGIKIAASIETEANVLLGRHESAVRV